MGEAPIVVRVNAVTSHRQNRKVQPMHVLTNHPDAALQLAPATIAERGSEAQVRARTRSVRSNRHTDRRLRRRVTG